MINTNVVAIITPLSILKAKNISNTIPKLISDRRSA